MNPEIETFEDLLLVPQVEDKSITRKTKLKRYAPKKSRRSSTDVSKISSSQQAEERKLLLKKKLDLRTKKHVVNALKNVKELAWARDTQYYDHFGTPNVDYVVFLNGAVQTQLFIHIMKTRAERKAYIEKLIADDPEAAKDPFAYLLQHNIVLLLGTAELRIKEKIAYIATLLQKT